MSTYRVEFAGYNDRRYSQPWIAKVTSWPVGKRPEMAWGGYLGNSAGGEVEIEALVGDIVRYGQKDYRGNNTRAFWAVAQADGTLSLCTEAEAAKAFRATEKHAL